MDFKIPTKIIFHGDRVRCQAVLGQAKSRLAILEERIRRSDGMVKQGWQQPITLDTGEVIYLGVSFNTSVIEIHAGGEEEEQFKIVRECLCNCNFAIGQIMTAVLSGTAPYESVGYEEAPFYIYSVEVCQRKDRYLLFENVIGSDFTPWVPGQVVLLMAYQGFSFGCCYPDPVAVFGEAFAAAYPAKGCTGQVSTVVDVEGLPDLPDHSWRPAFRILPFCALGVPKWIEDKVQVP